MCCLLTAGGIVTGIYSMVAYTTAFSLELWWIIEAQGDISIASYVLVTGFFVVFVASVFLMVGLILKKQPYLLTWIFITILFFFPECGLVLFMALYYWGLSRQNGVVELSFYVGRAFLNVLGIVCIQRLYSSRKEEKAVLKRLENLNISGSMLSDMSSPYKETLNGHHKSPSYLTSGHVNAAFSYGVGPPPEHHIYAASTLPIKVTRGPSCASSLHRYQETKPGPRVVSTPRIYWSGDRCEFDASSFVDYLVGRTGPPGRGFRSCQSDLQTATMSFDGGGGWENRNGHHLHHQSPPGPHPNGHFHPNGMLETQSLERSKGRQNGLGRRSRSLEQVPAAADPHHYYEEPNPSPEQSIRDIAL